MGLNIYLPASKKGFIISLFALIIASYIVFIFSTRFSSLPDDNTDTIENRIRSVNYHLENLFDFAQNAGAVSGYYAINGIIADINTRRQYNPSFDTQFGYCATYGNLTQTSLCPGMTNRHLNFYMNNITVAADKELKLTTSYRLNGVRFVQDGDPFFINLEYNLTINISDRLVNVSSTRLVVSRVSIEGLLDPVFLLNGTYNKTIRQHNVTKIAGTWNVNDLQQIYAYSTYRYTAFGVSFANRIRGNFTPDEFGIESIVNYTRPDVASLINQNLSMVDYLFWTRRGFDCQRLEVLYVTPGVIPSMPAVPAFQLDDVHRIEFNVSSTEVTATC